MQYNYLIVYVILHHSYSKPKYSLISTRKRKSGEFPRRHANEQFPVRRSTREKRLIFATLNTSDMLKQIEKQHAFPIYEEGEVLE